MITQILTNKYLALLVVLVAGIASTVYTMNQAHNTEQALKNSDEQASRQHVIESMRHARALTEQANANESATAKATKLP